MPDLVDPNFKRTVVLLVHHDDEGTFGLVLNRPTEVEASDLCETLEIDWQGGDDEEVHWGGPVQPNTGWMLCGEGALEGLPETTRLTDGVHFAGSLDALRRVAQSPPGELRLFLGYSGWGPGQLERELTQGAWIVAPLSRDVVFSVASDDMWDHVWRSLGIDPATIVSTPGVH
jgi:putative transcriptional regulator